MLGIGDRALVHYAETLDDGRLVCDSRKAGMPLAITIGKHELLPSVERILCDMEPGEQRHVTFVPALAYGAYDDSLVQRVPAGLLPNVDKLPVGGRIQLKTRVGAIDAKVVSVDDAEVVLDCNHEFAGRTATCDIELVSEVRETAIFRELHPVGCACGCDKLKAQLNRRLVMGLS